MTRNMDMSVPRQRQAPMPAMAGSVVMRAMRKPADESMLPEVNTVGKARLRAWIMASRLGMAALSSLYHDEMTMA